MTDDATTKTWGLRVVAERDRLQVQVDNLSRALAVMQQVEIRLNGQLNELAKELDDVKRIGGVNDAFRRMAVKERDYERVRNKRLMATLAQIQERDACCPHHYFSTACLHANEPGRKGLHKECQTTSTRWDGTVKIAGQCKYCEAPCGCVCHFYEADECRDMADTNSIIVTEEVLPQHQSD